MSASLPAQAIKEIIGQGSSASVQLSPESTLKRAMDSFDYFAEIIADLENQSGRDSELSAKIDEVVSAARSRFQRDAAKSLMELQKDGLLTLEESKGELRDLSDLHLAHLKETIDAQRLRIEAPPFRSDYESWFAYAGDALGYTVGRRNAPSRWLILLVWVAGGLAVAALLATFLKRWGKTLETSRPSLAVFLRSLSGPLHVIAALSGVSLGLAWIWMPYSLEDSVQTFLRIVIYGAFLWIAWGACGALAGLLGRLARRTRNDIDEEVVEIVRKCLRLLTLFVFIFLFAESLFGVDMKALLAGLGVLGLVMTLSLQGTIKNLIASFAIHADDLFQVGSLIRINGYFGEVEDIGFRASKIRTLDGHLVTLPNEVLTKDAVENVSARPFIRRRFRIDIEYQTPPGKVEEALAIVKEVIGAGDWQSPAQDQHVVFEEMAEYSLRILVVYHFQPADYWAAKENDSQINRQLVQRFNDAGIAFAFPTQSIDLLPRPDAPIVELDRDGDLEEPKSQDRGARPRPDTETEES